MLCLRLAILIVLLLVLVSSFDDLDELHEHYEKEQLKIHKDVCQMKPEFGRCKGRRTLWYFNDRYGKCLKFTYSNCGGNRNRFFSRDSCMEFCEKFDWKQEHFKHSRHFKRINGKPVRNMKLQKKSGFDLKS